MYAHYHTSFLNYGTHMPIGFMGWLISPCKTGFFLTLAAEKTKTQAQNSSQKLKEKTQPQGGTFLLFWETQEKNSILPKKI